MPGRSVGNFICRRYFRINLHASKVTHTDPSGFRVKTARFIGLTGLSGLSAVLDVIPYILSATSGAPDGSKNIINANPPSDANKRAFSFRMLPGLAKMSDGSTNRQRRKRSSPIADPIKIARESERDPFAFQPAEGGGGGSARCSSRR